jgi:hypothetical protein
MEQVEFMQRDLAGVGAVPQPRLIPAHLLARCRGEHDAWLLCWNLRTVKYTERHAAALLEISASHFCNILAGKKYPRWDLAEDFENLCGNRAVSQFHALRIGATLTFKTSEQIRIEQLESEVEQMRAAA